MPKGKGAGATRQSYFTSLLVVFIVCFGIALAALILTGVLYTKTKITLYFLHIILNVFFYLGVLNLFLVQIHMPFHKHFH
jgi:hypothetical protein